jgi:hypothetical protein
LGGILVEDLTQHVFEESVWVKIKINSHDTLLIGCIYRSPSSKRENNMELCNLLNSALSINSSHLLIMGDFNFKDIDWDNYYSNKTEENITCELQFVENLKDNFLYQHVREPTRFRDGQNPSLDDLILTNEEDMVECVAINNPLGKSDHAVLAFDFKCESATQIKSIPKPNYNKANFDKMKEELMLVNWDTLIEGKNLNETWNIFECIMNDLIKKHVPLNKPRSDKSKRAKPLWMTKEAAEAIRSKEKSFHLYRKFSNLHPYTKYAKARNECNRKIKNAKLNFEKKLVSEIRTNPKVFWKYVKSKLKTKDNIADLVKDDSGSLTNTDKEKVEVLNNFFCSVFIKENLNDSVPDLPELEISDQLNNVLISEDSVLKKLTKLKPTKSPGPDGFHPKLFNELKEVLTVPLCKIFRLSLKEKNIPQAWKNANITAIYKKGSKTQAGNYRPVSLTSIVCKLLESIIKDRIMEHMVDNNLFTPYQSGFMSGKSCVTQLLQVLDHWSDMLDQGENIDIVYLDFQKAFDTVPHKRLLNKMKSYRISDKLLDWVGSFLEGRKQRVVIGSNFSDWKSVVSGVPQGSVLGPVLFLIFINDLPLVVNSFVRLFADDTKVYNTVSTEATRDALQQDLNSLSDWSKTWLLGFNASKCKVLHLGRNNNNFTYYMSGTKLTTVQDEKDLGVTFDSSLKFSKHIHNCASKANQILGLIKRSFEYIDQDMFLTLYKTLVRPHLEYASSVWNPSLKKNIRCLEKVQRRATKLIKELNCLSYHERLTSLGLTTLEYRRKRNDMVQVYKIINGLDDMDRECFLSFITVEKTRGHNFKLFKKPCKTELRKNTFFIRIINTWNNLTNEVVEADSLNMFKHKLNQLWAEDCIKFMPSC